MNAAVGRHLFAICVAGCIARRVAAQADTTPGSVWDRSVHLTTFVGESFPLGHWGAGFESGDDGGIGVAWPVVHGSSIWLEGQFTGQSEFMRTRIRTAFQAAGSGASIYSLTLNLVVNDPYPLFGRLSPYVVGGGGGYYRHVELDHYAGTSLCIRFIGFCGVYGAPANRARTQNSPGWDLGGGVRVRLGSIWAFAESRYNAAYTHYGVTSFVPVVVGITW